MNHAEITIRPVAAVGQSSFINALNAAYADYFVPIYLTTQSFRDLVERESVRLDASQAALSGDEVVGTGLLGVRDLRGWIGGLGVVPASRRKGVARLLMNALIEAGRELGLESIQLEVITQNEPARRLYDSLGFETLRELHVLVCREPTTQLSANQIAPEVRISAEPPARLLPHLAMLPAARRPWQRELEAHRAALSGLRGLAARTRLGEVVGVCLYRSDSLRHDIVDLAATSPRVGLATAVHLLRQSPGATFTYLNVAEDDPLLPDLLQIGFQTSLSQYEMLLPLTPETHRHEP
ncbi:MAG TPA: GNAT family N-acetyltransferase [Aggregatilineales bacterium]|jgi:ribosomal protein S18 acetylase RimI-like enzyme|nr:GNAT family N-acetyltransferase [Chloroflexota bacterium]HOA22642.1 GNAT family N-acetyltransferase [Aggregatilineales bacterium]HQA68638.1 GNAT family N-acetyltransferase [Aggregatilineales bacterium]HQE18408.1 GNAT family N-acetyltransferase [Aggregatilineales bacterium]